MRKSYIPNDGGILKGDESSCTMDAVFFLCFYSGQTSFPPSFSAPICLSGTIAPSLARRFIVSLPLLHKSNGPKVVELAKPSKLGRRAGKTAFYQRLHIVQTLAKTFFASRIPPRTILTIIYFQIFHISWILTL